LGNTKQLPVNMNRLPRKIGPDLGRIGSKPRKIEPSSGKEKPVRGNTNQLLGNVDRLSGKADPATELGLGKAKPGLSYGCGLREELEPILGKEDNEESVTKKSEFGNVGSPIDEDKTEPMMEYDSIKGSGTIRTDWRLPLLECIRDLGKTMDKKVKRQVLKYTSLDNNLYQRTIDGEFLKCLGEEQAKVAVREVHDTSGGNKFCAGTHYLSVWSPTNSNNRSTTFIRVTPI
jgi:hypothetical protein